MTLQPLRIQFPVSKWALFLPVISAAAQARLEGYFRFEWDLAGRRTHAMAAARPFLLPVVSDAKITTDAALHQPFLDYAGDGFRASQP